MKTSMLSNANVRDGGPMDDRLYGIECVRRRQQSLVYCGGPKGRLTE